MYSSYIVDCNGYSTVVLCIRLIRAILFIHIIMHNAFFETLEEFSIVICRKCRHAVWPSQIEAHLRRAHRHVSTTMHTTLANNVRTWPDIAQDPIQLDIPAIRTRAIPQLVQPVDGYRYQLSPHSCQYVCTTIPTMQQHWIQQHQWSRSRKTGHPTRMEQRQIQQQQDQACYPVRCQRLFPQPRRPWSPTMMRMRH
jgi:hypothetical protein